MNSIEKLKIQRARFEEEVSNLREALKPFEKPINVLLAPGKKFLPDLSLQEIAQVTNLLIAMHEEILVKD